MLIKSITKCPKCGAECDVEVKDGEHHYVPKSKDEPIIWHKYVGKDRKGNNINLCGRKGAAIDGDDDAVNCEKCLVKMQGNADAHG